MLSKNFKLPADWYVGVWIQHRGKLRSFLGMYQPKLCLPNPLPPTHPPPPPSLLFTFFSLPVGKWKILNIKILFQLAPCYMVTLF